MNKSRSEASWMASFRKGYENFDRNCRGAVTIALEGHDVNGMEQAQILIS